MEQYCGTITEPGLPVGLPGIVHYILLICENVVFRLEHDATINYG